MKQQLVAGFAALTLGLAAPVLAQERPNTILVLDASGSMWGQVDGVNKITIARKVVADVLATFPADQNLGLVTYGHRERGQCSDIETVVAPAPGTAAEIIRIVDGLNPRGMTPMTDAVIAAAQALRHTEQAATVILVSDGIETCNPDPCAAARALEQAGVDFTTHVIGFDVRGEAGALMQMQCIAEETGGTFLTADNAAELSAALQMVVAPVTGIFTFTAHHGQQPVGSDPEWVWPVAPITEPLLPGAVKWEISDAELKQVASGTGNPFSAELPFGAYVISVESEEWGASARREEVLEVDSIRDTHVIFPQRLPDPVGLTLRAVLGSDSGPLIETPVTWGFSMAGDSFELDGNPAAIELRPGTWAVTGYHTAAEQEKSAQVTLVAGQNQLVSMVFDLPAAPLPTGTVSAPAQAVVGAAFPVSWTGEDLDPRDYVTVVAVGAKEGAYTNYQRVTDQTEGRLFAPAEPGLYEVRLQLEDGGKVIASTPIEVVDAQVSVSAPAQVVVGAAFPVTWVAAGLNPQDYVTIVAVGAKEGSYTNFQRISDKAEGRLFAPAEAGLYEVRLQLDSGVRVLASTPVEVVEADVTVSAPAQVVVGSAFPVTWLAAGLNPQDYITIVPVGARVGAYTNFQRISDKREGQLLAPGEPGLYEVRLQLDQGERVLASTGIEVVEADVALSAAEQVRAGGEIAVSWTGAVHPQDYVTIVPAGADDGAYTDYVRVGTAAQGKLTAAEDPGLYELRYRLEYGGRVLARRAIEVLAADAPMDAGAGLSAPDSARPGATITVSWTGGGTGADQRIALARADQADFSWISAQNAAGNSSLEITLPDTPGSYELRFLDVTGKAVLGRRLIEVAP